MRRLQHIVALILVACAVSVSRASGHANLDSALTVLDQEIESRTNYSKIKEAHIGAVRDRLNAGGDYISEFNALSLLYDEFRHYQSDSACHYSKRMEAIADLSGDKGLQAMACAAKFDYLVSVWLVEDAYDEFSHIDENLLQPRERVKFYKNVLNLLYRMMDQPGEFDNIDDLDLYGLYNGYLKNIVELSEPGTYDYEMHRLKIMESYTPRDARASIERRDSIMRLYDFSDKDRAALYASMGAFALSMDDKREAAYYDALSAIYDIRSSTHETAAIHALANLMNDFDDSERAVRYIRVAFDDALFFNSRLKQFQIGTILPLIETIRYDHLAGQRRTMAALLLVITVLLCLSIVLVLKVSRRNKRLESMRRSLNVSQSELAQSNAALSQLNAKLKETLTLKDSYIMQSLYVNTGFLKQVEERCRDAINGMKTKGLEAVRFLPYQMGIKEERQRIMRSFDQTFIQVFPNFIDDFNSLLAGGETVSLGDDGGLSTELRIFALMRLGISDTATVSDFLNISVSSIYVYKARVKAKSSLSKSDFDAAVMAIPKP